MRAAIYLAAQGPLGLRETAELCLRKSRYARQQLVSTDRFQAAFAQPTFKEFVVRDTQGDVNRLVDGACESGYLAGVALGRWFPELEDCLLIAVTEKRTRAEIDGLVQTLTPEQREVHRETDR